MGKWTCADSARNANIAKALLKKRKINDENKENERSASFMMPNVSDTLNMLNVPATSVGTFVSNTVKCACHVNQGFLWYMPVVEQCLPSAQEEPEEDIFELLPMETEEQEDFEVSNEAGEEVRGSEQDDELRDGHRQCFTHDSHVSDSPFRSYQNLESPLQK
ncbi:hypothetical protein F4604DRAFT_1687835 [Suillus subluteus]|nr:hypothetical protein F4604DRAFT_1687835 [Suillus subluteus]